MPGLTVRWLTEASLAVPGLTVRWRTVPWWAAGWAAGLAVRWF
ncbi:hypothetical protein [Streptantibioticus silvisoli]|uniref:Uncharacterized protein n=1 Tax=Streptantibioticus silvisoli TaxID=2705255 RepID=A0ABT6VWU2_9ACTN|nr:hypothetical protein [Streptantibioticus silvisoli]MDI5962953.1 hypothetical protein [Streptantibioticus silvisoli]